MTFKNIFGGGANEAKSAEDAAHGVDERIPGARPEREGVDPELFDGIPDEERDPKIVRETSPEAIAVMRNFIAPLFKNTQNVAAEQRAAAEDPGSTVEMASSARDEAAEGMEAEIREEDRPGISDEEREELKKGHHAPAGNAGEG